MCWGSVDWSGSAPHAGHGVGASGPVTVGAERAPPGNDALGHGVELIVGHVERPRGGRAGATSRSESFATATRVLAAYDLLTTD